MNDLINFFISLGLEIPLIMIAPQYSNSVLLIFVIVGWQFYIVALLMAMEVEKEEALVEAKKRWDVDLVAFYELYVKVRP